METQAVNFIQDLAIIMIVAGIMTVLCHRFKQPVVLGYIIAGIIVGPYTPSIVLIHDIPTIRVLAELGVIFLLFSLGLEFDLHQLKKVGLGAFVCAFTEIIFMMWIGYKIGLLLHWSAINALFLGAILAISSTTIIIKTLEELGLKKEKFAQLIFGILILEDVFAIAILALLSGIALSGALHIEDVFMTTLRLSSFLVISLVVGILCVPKLLSYVNKFKNKEMLLISVLGLCFGYCLLVMKLDYSVALGAFVMGAIIAESKQLSTIEHMIGPLRDMFSAIFFVSVGLLFNPSVFIEYAYPIVLLTLVVIIGKVLVCGLATFAINGQPRTALKVGMGLGQIGEFSFIIAGMGLTLHVTSNFLFPIAVAVSALTTFTTPYLIRYSDPFANWLAQHAPKPVKHLFGRYEIKLQKIKFKNRPNPINSAVYHLIFLIILNLLIVSAIFLACGYLALSPWGLAVIKLTSLTTQRAIFWGLALTASLPCLIAIYQKLKTLCMVSVEASITGAKIGPLMMHLRRILSTCAPLFILSLFLLFVAVVNDDLLPPTPLLLMVSLPILAIGACFYAHLTKLHSKLHIHLMESMDREGR